MKSLLLVRHAKTEDRSSSGRDFDRALVKRGRDNAQQLAFELLALKWNPDVLLSSSARRARETSAILCTALQIPENAQIYRDDLYLSDESLLLATIAKTDHAVQRLVIVAHNPGISALAHYLKNEVLAPLPTCGAVLFKVPAQHWTDVFEDCAQLERSFLPH